VELIPWIEFRSFTFLIGIQIRFEIKIGNSETTKNPAGAMSMQDFFVLETLST
jgi:hypothetical protein